jgi:hypothetical protein
MLIALIAPEHLLLLAINQRIDAHVLKTRVTRYLQSQPMAKPGPDFDYILCQAKPDYVNTHKRALVNMAGDTTPLQEYPLGPVHAFYMIMGGLRFEGYSNSRTVPLVSTTTTPLTISFFV